jgi:hypothetical protein
MRIRLEKKNRERIIRLRTVPKVRNELTNGVGLHERLDRV